MNIVEPLYGAFMAVLKISFIIIPIMIAMEIARDLKWIDLISKWMHPITKHFKIADEGTVLVTIGLVFGLTYGAGVIIQSTKEGRLDNRSIVIVVVFLAICHAVFEDALLFTVMGANGALLIAIRFIAAILITLAIAYKVKIQK